jgi:uncharacterized protein with ParB-like and HNH nuclease domain
MADDEKLTNNTDEAALGELFDGSLIYEVPYFQRPYKWKPKKLLKFQEDLLDLLEGEENEDLHFMGAIIVQGRRTAPAAARPYQVIDGQQRLTTVFLHVLATVRVLIENDSALRAKAVFLAHLVTRNETGSKSNLRLSPSGQDREDLNNVINDVLSLEGFGEDLDGFTFKPLAVGQGSHSRQISKNFKIALSFMRNQFEEGGNERIESLIAAILQRMTVVQIDIKNALDGPKIFDSLNSAQETMTVGELVKNDIFSRGMDAADDQLETLENLTWSPFFNKFGGNKLFDEYFFPYGLFHNPNWRKTDVYSELQRTWSERELTPAEIIAELSEIQPDFLEIASSESEIDLSKSIRAAIKNLRDSNCPSSIYPFVMHITHAVRQNNLDPEVALKLLTRLESFLVRRGICGLEPTGLHAVFKGLWQEIQRSHGAEIPTAMDTAIRSRPTVQWPTDQDVTEKILTRNLYASRITRFLLREFDKSLEGDHPETPFQIEHVLPQNPAIGSEWLSTFTEIERADLQNTVGNLAIVSQQMNQDVSNRDYAEKRPVFKNEAMFRSTRDLGNNHEVWTPETIRERNKSFAAWAIGRWRY